MNENPDLNRCPSFSRTALELIAARFRLLGDASRLELLQHTVNKECSVKELCELTGLGQANVSKHLGLLSEHGLVQKHREKSFSHFRAVDDSVGKLCSIAFKALEKRYSSLAQEFSRD